MDDFNPAYPQTIRLNPNKRVYFSHGLVMGVDEFAQEQLYHLEKNRLHNRGLHGYGTVCGLDVSIESGPAGPEVSVSPGIAVDPQGREIRVAESQCARLNDWLIRHRDEVIDEFGSPPIGSPSVVERDVMLCYDECQTDGVPVPSGPCQSLDRTNVASRTVDDFRLELQPPRDDDPTFNAEERAVRELASLLSEIPVLEDPGGMTDEEIIALIRNYFGAATGSPAVGSPPVTITHLTAAEALDRLRTAFRVWVTEIRPGILPGQRNCAGGPPDEDCVLLARVRFAVDDTAAGFRVDGDVDVDQANRPFLLHTRLIQEYLASCCVSGQVLPAIGSPGGGGVTDHSALSNLDQDDHDQYLLENGSRTILGPQSLGGNQINDLADAVLDTDALPLGQLNTALADHIAGDEHTEYLLRDGSRELTGNLRCGLQRLTNLRDPDAPRDAVNLRTLDARAPYVTAAAGRVDETGGFVSFAGNWRSRLLGQGQFLIELRPYDPGRSFIVKGTPIAPEVAGADGIGVFNVIEFRADGIVLYCGQLRVPDALGFMLEIFDYTAPL